VKGVALGTIATLISNDRTELRTDTNLEEDFLSLFAQVRTLRFFCFLFFVVHSVKGVALSTDAPLIQH
jgi:hypothetical protein